MFAIPLRVRGQTATERALSKGVVAVGRFTDHLEIPKAKQAAARLDVELGSWVLADPSREVTVPPQGFYVAELQTGDVVTIIDGKETTRRSGDLWAVEPGQTMGVRFAEKRRQNAILRVLSLRPAP